MSRSLLIALADGRPWQASQLIDTLCISSMELEANVACLQEMGICFSNSISTYQLDHQIELLDFDLLLSKISTIACSHVSKLDIEWSIDSTNNYCLRKLQNGESISGLVCLAEHQFWGRGRRGRCWISPLASSIYLSIGWRFHGSIQALDGLSLAVGVVLAKLLEDDFFVRGIMLKWPNDILCYGEKIAGVLIDVVSNGSGASDVVIGVGINVDMRRQIEVGIDQPWTDIRRTTGRCISRNLLAANVIGKLIQLLKSYDSCGFSYYQEQWSSFDVFAGKTVSVEIHGNNNLTVGVSSGVTNRGDLVLNVNGVKRIFSAGEVRLRHG